MNIKYLGEFGLIDLIKKQVPSARSVIKGIGDDTAVLPYTKDAYLLFTTDMMAEGVHFTRHDAPALIGRKALAVNISDIAAMGGLPTDAVVSIGLPKVTKVNRVKDIYQGMGLLAKQFGVSIVGGDTIKSNRLIINVALLGKVRKKDLVLRSGAKPGDAIFVTGPLGGSLKSKRHLSFTPRVKEAQWLLGHARPSAMMDISDGLAGDLNHLLRASRVGAHVDMQAIPCNLKATLKQALCDGEDFELLFTVPLQRAKKLVKYKQFYRIGTITSNPRELVHETGYRHF